MRCGKLLMVVFLLVLVLLATTSPAQSLSLRGRVSWRTGAPAIGLEVRLMQDNRVLATTYTNANGLYAFFDISQPLHDFIVVVADRNQTLGEKHLSFPVNGIIPDIVI